MRPDDPSIPRVSRIGLVGLGYWGPNLLRVLAEMPQAEVSWICDLDPERLSAMARKVPDARRTHEIQDLLDDPELDAVVIATPIFSHHELACRALEAGKHVFVEKPLAATTADAEHLLTAAREAGLVLMCGHTFLYSPAVLEVKRMLDGHELGDLYFISSSRVNLGLHQRDVSVLWDLGPHDFSILLHWLPERPGSVRAVGRASIVPGVPDIAFVTLTYPSGLLVNVELSWLAPSKLRRTVVVGSEKMVVYDDGSAEPIRVFDSGVVYEDPETFGQYHLSYRTGDIVSPRLATSEPLVSEMADFLQAVARRDPMPAAGRLAVDVVQLVEAAEASLGEGGADVAVSWPAEAVEHRS